MLHQTIEKNIEPQSRSLSYILIYILRDIEFYFENLLNTPYIVNLPRTREIRAELCISHELID